MKRNYEIALMQHVHGSVEDDYETVLFEFTSGYSYRECKTKAKELSKHIGKENVPGISYKFTKKQRIDAGLAAVKIVCYTKNNFTDYQPLYHEYYKDGKVDYKITFNE